jgi:hypothetical protein
VPPEWIRAHERRRYAIKQPDKPECGFDLSVGAACRCAETTLRDTACRTDASPAQVGFCAFEIDDAKKLLTNVTYRSQ